MEAEVSSGIFVQAVCCLAAQGCIGLVHRKYIEGGQVSYKQSYSVTRSALLTINRPKVPKIVFFIQCLQ